MSSTAGLPPIILELMVDVLIHSMGSLPLEALATEDHSVTHLDGRGAERRTLWNMSLVHRTWTHLARRGLWYRIIIREGDLADLDVLTNAPSCSLIRELVVLDSGFDATSRLENLAGILHHSPNLRKLYFDLDIESPTEPGVFELLQQFRSCSQLEYLWLVGDIEGCYQETLLAVSSLPSLKSLVLDAVSIGNFSDSFSDTGALQQLNPPKVLKSVALFDALDLKDSLWLIRPHDGYRIEDLAFSVEGPEQFEEDPESMEQFNQCLPFLRTLSISTNMTAADVESAIHSECLGHFLARAHNLRRFTLTASMLRTASLRLPDMLSTFHVHHDIPLGTLLSKHSDSAWKENDGNIATVILNSPTRLLQKVVLSFTSDDRVIDAPTLSHLQNEIFSETRKTSLLTGVTLGFETYASPYFGTLSEIGPFV